MTIDAQRETLATLAGLCRMRAEHSKRYPRGDPGHVLRSLAYFGDADASPLPRGLDGETWAAIRHDFETWVRDV